jgi:hypothetical protein
VTETDPAGGPRLERRYAIAIAGGFAAGAAVGLLILSYRFGIGMPALIDDWVYATQPAKSPGELLELFFEPYIGRFRPGYELWSHAEWHLLGAPGELVAPNFFAAFRLLLICAALAVLPGVVAATARPRPKPALLLALGIAAVVVVFSSPASDLDFLRLGTQEPLFIGSAVCGVALLVWATGRLLAGEARRSLIAAGLISGYCLWALAVYHKEASVVLIAAAPFLYLHLDRRWRERGVHQGPPWRSRAVQLVALAMLAPVVHVVVGASTVSEHGFGVYGAEQPSGIGEWIDRLLDATDAAWDTFPAIGMTEWRHFMLALVPLTAAVAWRRRSVPWLAAGLIVTGFALLVFQGILLLPVSRYAIPGIVLCTMAAVLLLAQLPPWMGWSAVLCALTLAISNYSDVRDTLAAYRSWETKDNRGTIDFVAQLHPESCPVYMMNLVAEQSESIPKLLGLREDPLTGPCREEFEGAVVGYEHYPGGPLGLDDSMRRACTDPEGPVVLRETPGYLGFPPGFDSFPPLQVLGCRRFGRRVDGEPMNVVFSRSRLVPGEGNFATRDRCAARYGSEGCYP